jgi:hypothetical protein
MAVNVQRIVLHASVGDELLLWQGGMMSWRFQIWARARHLNARDAKAVLKAVSGHLKLLHPHEDVRARNWLK